MPDPTFPNTQQDQTNTPPPTFPGMTDIPSIPQTPQETNTTTTPPVSSLPTEEIAQTPADIPPIVTTGKKPKKKGGIIATILGIFLLIGAVGAGVVLINQNQDVREKAALPVQNEGCLICELNKCTKSPDFPSCNNNLNECSQIDQPCGVNNIPAPAPTTVACIEEFGNCSITNDRCCSGLSCTSGKCQELVPPSQGGIPTTVDYCSKIIKTATSIGCPADLFNAGTCWVNHYWCPDMTYGQIHNGCPSESYTGTENTVAINVQSASFSKDCGVEQIDVYYPACTDLTKKFISQVDPPCTTSTAPPSDITAACASVKTYGSDWNALSDVDLKLLSAGDVVYFTVSGTPADKITKARFTINGTQGAEVITKKDGTNEYYVSYTIPEGITSFTVSAQVYHVTLGWF